MLNFKSKKQLDKERKLKYFGSDLNEFAHTECSKQMTVINIDMLQYKRSKKILRIIESKHEREKTPASQLEALTVLAKVFKYINKIAKHKFEAYIVKGNPPYDRTFVENLITGEKEILDRKELIEFLEFRKEI